MREQSTIKSENTSKEELLFVSCRPALADRLISVPDSIRLKASTRFVGVHRLDGLHVMITQANIRSILPGKIANVAMLLAKRKGISGMEALRMFYCSDVYNKLEREETKYWWQSPEQLSRLI